MAQVAGETEVKAQIKLRFRTATSQPVVVIRTFQVLLTHLNRQLPVTVLVYMLHTINFCVEQAKSQGFAIYTCMLGCS